MPETLHFDGSCDPNPGGRMGLGYVITWADGRQTPGQAEHAPHRANSNNRAEYLALIAGLTAYRDAGGRGPLRVIGDSQLVIQQVTGAWRCRDAALVPLCADARRLLTGLDADLTWVPREQNRAADLLSAGTDAAAPETRTILPTPDGLRVAPALARTIRSVNALAHPGFRDLARLRVGGTDALSAWKLPALLRAVPEAVAGSVQAAFAGDAAIQAAVLRWCLRGLAVEVSIHKGRVDLEIRANAAHGRRR